MSSAVCTLFEGDYHYGVGALANSLYANGFRGTIYAGYRGQLPPWVTEAEVRSQTSDLRPQTSENITDFSPAHGLTLRFIPVTTTIHLTNYKPDFMLELWEKHCPQAAELFYFDPDIVVRFPWSFFEEWASDAVAMCEDVNSPMPSSHPKRNAWRRLLTSKGLEFKNRPEIYVNGGFVALPATHKEFLKLWSRIIIQMGEAGVDLNAISTANDYRFWNNDQDAMNIASMVTNCPTSTAGKDGMGFTPCNSFMLHALGAGKPWQVSFFGQFLSGKRITPAQREYWEFVTAPIALFTPMKIAFIWAEIKITTFGSRFYGK
jgi:hypothetical protein